MILNLKSIEDESQKMYTSPFNLIIRIINSFITSYNTCTSSFYFSVKRVLLFHGFNQQLFIMITQNTCFYSKIGDSYQVSLINGIF